MCVSNLLQTSVKVRGRNGNHPTCIKTEAKIKGGFEGGGCGGDRGKTWVVKL